MVVTRLLDSPLLQRAIAETYVRSGLIDRICERDRRLNGAAFRVLRYQRISRLETLPYPPYLTSVVSPQALRAQFQYLRRTTQIISLAELLTHWSSKEKLPERCAVITFDGGWVEHAQVARNLLAEFEFPATFFVPTAFVSTQNMFWHDKVQAVLLSMSRANLAMPAFETLSVEVNYILQQPDEAITPLKILVLLEVLAKIPKPELSLFLQELAMLSAEVPLIELPRSFLTWDELRSIEQSGHTIATLGHTHRRFTDIAREEVAIEAHTAFHELRQNGLSPLPVMAAPNGETSPEVCETLRAIGCSVCLTVGRDAPTGDLGTFLTLPRVPIFEHSSISDAHFACRIWGAKLLGYYVA